MFDLKETYVGCKEKYLSNRSTACILYREEREQSYLQRPSPSNKKKGANERGTTKRN
jgi:hypothetical protein